MHASPLTLIPWARPEALAGLRSTLTCLGYDARVASEDLVNPAQMGVADGPLVFLLGAGPKRRPLTTELLLLRQPALVLLVRGECAWDEAILTLGCDWAQWPCSRGELAFRLGRLGPSPDLAEGPGPDIDGLLERVDLVGRSPAFLAAMQRVRRMLACNAPVLIGGETGTGKELVARAIHYLGPRSDGPLVPVNCGALPDHLVENELFGHARGAYTDARTEAMGAIGEAAGGTLFLDEVEALSPKAQAALLRFLQDGEYRPLGAGHARRSDARVLAATNTDLRACCAEHRFRPDLFYRLDILSITLPPLRDRGEDVETLARHFIHQYCAEYNREPLRLDSQSLSFLRTYAWPGNVRELQNLIHRGVLLAEGRWLFLAPGSADGPLPEVPPSPTDRTDPRLGQGFAAAKAQAIAVFEREYLRRLMTEAGGNVTLAARRAGKERRALGKLLKKYGVAASGGD